LRFYVSVFGVIKDRYSIDYISGIYLDSAMSYTTVDTSNPTGNYDFEACDRINEGEARAGTRAGFDGWLQHGPGSSTSVVNGLSQQLIHQMNLILPDALVKTEASKCG
jgi:hypothetical protein